MAFGASLLAFLSPVLWGAPPEIPASLTTRLGRLRLDDGPRVVLSSRPASPVVAVCARYAAPPALSPAAGAVLRRRAGRVELDGGRLCVTVPAHEHELALWAVAGAGSPVALSVTGGIDSDSAASALRQRFSGARGAEPAKPLAIDALWATPAAPSFAAPAATPYSDERRAQELALVLSAAAVERPGSPGRLWSNSDGSRIGWQGERGAWRAALGQLAAHPPKGEALERGKRRWHLAWYRALGDSRRRASALLDAELSTGSALARARQSQRVDSLSAAEVSAAARTLAEAK
jgi:hypothetical protein